MKTKKNKNEREMGNYAQMYLDPGQAVLVQRSETIRRPENAMVLGQLGNGMGFSVKAEEVKRALGMEREYDK